MLLQITKQLTQNLKNHVDKYREDHALHNKLYIPAEDYATFAGAEDVGDQLMRMTSSLNLGAMSAVPEFAEMASTAGGDMGRNVSESELLDFMTKCLESRNVESLDFMADFFRDNTISQTMVKSTARVVWLQDWYPIKDCIYSISVDRQKKRVLVVFRGAITRADWSHGFDAAMKRGLNPVKDEYEGKKSYLKIHRGFYTYMFRTRKDTSTRKYDEIASKVYEYGTKLIGNDFTVTVNGYSLGGALSVLFGFYASTGESSNDWLGSRKEMCNNRFKHSSYFLMPVKIAICLEDLRLMLNQACSMDIRYHCTITYLTRMVELGMPNLRRQMRHCIFLHYLHTTTN